jgi:hypothetical protein
MGALRDPASRLPPLLAVVVISALSALSCAIVIAVVRAVPAGF